MRRLCVPRVLNSLRGIPHSLTNSPLIRTFTATTERNEIPPPSPPLPSHTSNPSFSSPSPSSLHSSPSFPSESPEDPPPDVFKYPLFREILQKIPKATGKGIVKLWSEFNAFISECKIQKNWSAVTASRFVSNAMATQSVEKFLSIPWTETHNIFNGIVNGGTLFRTFPPHVDHRIAKRTVAVFQPDDLDLPTACAAAKFFISAGYRPTEQTQKVLFNLISRCPPLTESLEISHFVDTVECLMQWTTAPPKEFIQKVLQQFEENWTFREDFDKTANTSHLIIREHMMILKEHTALLRMTNFDDESPVFPFSQRLANLHKIYFSFHPLIDPSHLAFVSRKDLRWDGAEFHWPQTLIHFLMALGETNRDFQENIKWNHHEFSNYMCYSLFPTVLRINGSAFQIQMNRLLFTLLFIRCSSNKIIRTSEVFLDSVDHLLSIWVSDELLRKSPLTLENEKRDFHVFPIRPWVIATIPKQSFHFESLLSSCIQFFSESNWVPCHFLQSVGRVWIEGADSKPPKGPFATIFRRDFSKVPQRQILVELWETLAKMNFLRTPHDSLGGQMDPFIKRMANDISMKIKKGLQEENISSQPNKLWLEDTAKIIFCVSVFVPSELSQWTPLLDRRITALRNYGKLVGPLSPMLHLLIDGQRTLYSHLSDYFPKITWAFRNSPLSLVSPQVADSALLESVGSALHLAKLENVMPKVEWNFIVLSKKTSIWHSLSKDFPVAIRFREGVKTFYTFIALFIPSAYHLDGGKERLMGHHVVNIMNLQKGVERERTQLVNFRILALPYSDWPFDDTKKQQSIITKWIGAQSNEESVSDSPAKSLEGERIGEGESQEPSSSSSVPSPEENTEIPEEEIYDEKVVETLEEI